MDNTQLPSEYESGASKEDPNDTDQVHGEHSSDTRQVHGECKEQSRNRTCNLATDSKFAYAEDDEGSSKFKVDSYLSYDPNVAKGTPLTWPKCKTMGEVIRKRLPPDDGKRV